MSASNHVNPLLYDDTRRSADALYFGGVSVPDPFVAFGAKGRKVAIVNALEFGRVKRESAFDRVLALESYLARARKLWPRRKIGIAEVVRLAARDFGVPAFTVPQDFPAGLYRRLSESGVKVRIADGPLFPEREIKSAREAAAVREGNRCSALGIAAAERMLRGARLRKGLLHHSGSVLTSERLKVAIETACIEAGALSAETIAAGGNQGCDPHHRGSGPLRVNELIVVDVFPRVSDTGYYGDMTRTFLRGRANDAQKALVAAVREAQTAALKTVRAGVDGREVHKQAVRVFETRGFVTRRTAKGSVGFFHGTGHGLGLDIHEPPRMNATVEYLLKEGSVVTVEPGLYYPGVGGCRIEDVVQVTRRAPRMLSDFHYNWELR